MWKWGEDEFPADSVKTDLEDAIVVHLVGYLCDGDTGIVTDPTGKRFNIRVTAELVEEPTE